MKNGITKEFYLLMGSKLGIRLSGVTFPQEGNARVVFELFADGYEFGDSRTSLAEISQEATRKHTDSSAPNYVEIVGEAAKKLEEDFKRIVETLADTYEKK